MRGKYQLLWLICLFSLLTCLGIPANAQVTTQQKTEYTDVLSGYIRNGTENGALDAYRTLSSTTEGKKCMQQALINNRAALIAEDIDFLDSSWKHYYSVKKTSSKTVLYAPKAVSRSTYKKRYANVMKGLNKVLSCVDSSMTDADKAAAVYTYLCKNTLYRSTRGGHTGYDVLVNGTGVCDGLANVYALAMNTLGIECTVVAHYEKDHSWNLTKIGSKWYLSDLTLGVGSGIHEGKVVSYQGNLVGVSAFLKTHSGYSKSDIYGTGNSNGLNLKSLAISNTDYIPASTSIKNGIYARPCMAYHDGYWYWVSTDNNLKKSKLNGAETRTVYRATDTQNVGWVDDYNGRLYVSVNDKIYRMNYTGTAKTLMCTVKKTEYRSQNVDFFWQVAYVGRFLFDTNGKMKYYVYDLHGANKGKQTISVGALSASATKPSLTKKTINLNTGLSARLSMLNGQKGEQIKWSSSNPSVAAVDQNGLVTGIKKGSAVITAVCKTKKAVCKVNVTGYKIIYKNVLQNADGNYFTASGKSAVVLKAPKKAGYAFVGWYADAGLKKRITSIKKGNTLNKAVYAKWKKK